MTIYRLEYEDLTHLGGPMGTEYTTSDHMGNYSSLSGAKAAAQHNYQLKMGNVVQPTLKWHKHSRKGMLYWHTDDLGFVMYNIYQEKVNV